MNFYTLENDIKNFTRENFRSGSVPALSYMEEMPIDLDKHKMGEMCYIDFENYFFNALTNLSDAVTGNVKFFFVVQRETPAVLSEKIKKAVGDFVDFIQTNRTLGGIVDGASVKSIDFYLTPEFNAAIKAAAVNIEITVEEMD